MIVLDLETVPICLPLGVAWQIGKIDEKVEELELTIEEADALAATYCALTPPLAEIAVAGLYTTDERKIALVNMQAFGGAVSSVVHHAMMPGEASLVDRVFAYLDDGRRYPLVTFNGRRFDLLVLLAAALRRGVQIPPAVMGLMTEYRFSKEPRHIDMYEVLTNYGAGKGSLRAWCIGLGLGDPKENGDGAEVSKLVAEGKVAEVAEYCLSDCSYTARLYERYLECTKGK